ncbi:UNVERIFIED_CONTAM: hypothetical protein Slati_3682900 [Sesamum latifolium]|uniref:DUF4283 domain-containing protein n=1 Tax=Sesamum latifolium TaxID=2727402 RepID=A0AAW2U2Z1_9LAMI
MGAAVPSSPRRLFPIAPSLSFPRIPSSIDSLTRRRRKLWFCQLRISVVNLILYQVKFLPVGKVLSHRNTNFDALRNVLTSLLQPVKGVVIKRVSEERFCLQFNHRLDMQRALEGRLWVFDKNLLLLESVDDGKNPLDVCLDSCPFTVFVHDIPLSLQTKNIAEHIGNKLGRFIDTEHHKDGINWCAAWKLKLSLNVLKPLSRAMRLKSTRGEEILDFVYPGEALPFGQWMRSSNPTRFSNNIPGSLRQSSQSSNRPYFIIPGNSSVQERRNNQIRGVRIFGDLFGSPNGKVKFNKDLDEDQTYGKRSGETNVVVNPRIPDGTISSPPSQPTSTINPNQGEILATAEHTNHVSHIYPNDPTSQYLCLTTPNHPPQTHSPILPPHNNPPLFPQHSHS